MATPVLNNSAAFFGGREETKTQSASRTEILGVTAILLLAAALRIWNLSQNGWANDYYAAAVRSMIGSWHNFFYGSFDPAGFITVDKPPVALWAQALSAKLFGFNSWAILLPQALMGVACVLVLYALVRRAFGVMAGLVAALALAVMPISIAVDRANLPDTLLTLLLLLAAWAVTKASEKGSLLPLLACGALVGMAFNTKMLEAYIPVPVFGLLYLLSAPIPFEKRALHLAAATAVLLMVSLSWPVTVDSIPASQRPYIGGSTKNSVMELIFGYNGIGRVAGGSGNPSGGMRPPGGGRFPGGPGGGPSGMFGPGGPGGGQGMPPMPPGMSGMPGMPPMGANGMPPFPPGMPKEMQDEIKKMVKSDGFRIPRGGPMDAGTPGPLRLADTVLSSQAMWLAPLGLIGLLLAATRRKDWSLPLNDRGQALVLWGGWLLLFGGVFSFAQGIFHPYYLVVLAPAVAALAGIAFVLLQEEYALHEKTWRRYLLPAALILTAAAQAGIVADQSDWRLYLWPALGAGTLLALIAAGIALMRRDESFSHEISGRIATTALATGLVTLLIAPTAYALTAVIRPGMGGMPSAGPSSMGGFPFGGPPGMGGGMPGMPGGPGGMRGGPGRGGRSSEKLIAFLHQNHQGEKYMLVTSDIHSVSDMIIKTGEPYIALGGFLGGDPSRTVKQFADMVAKREVRYAMTGGMGGPPGMEGGIPGMPGGMRGGPPGMGGNNANAAIFEWIQKHGKPVDKSLWQETPPQNGGDQPGGFGGPRGRGGGSELYDLRP